MKLQPEIKSGLNGLQTCLQYRCSDLPTELLNQQGAVDTSGDDLRKLTDVFDFNFIILFFHLESAIYVFEMFAQIKILSLVLLMPQKKVESLCSYVINAVEKKV